MLFKGYVFNIIHNCIYLVNLFRQKKYDLLFQFKSHLSRKENKDVFSNGFMCGKKSLHLKILAQIIHLNK
jgi:hypothetical protein